MITKVKESKSYIKGQVQLWSFNCTETLEGEVRESDTAMNMDQ